VVGVVWWRRLSIGVAVAVFSAAGGRARAQSPADEVPRFPVAFEASRPDFSIRVSGVALDLPCGQRCVLELPEGQYRITATHPDGRRSAKSLVIRGPQHVTVTPHNQTARVVGYVLMPAGAGTAGVGVALLWWAGFKALFLAMTGCTGDCYTRETSSLFWPGGAIVLGAGVVIGLTGVAFWKANASAGLDVTPLASGRNPNARLRVQPSAGPRWAGLALSGSF
jgi:hypothetical protein